MPFLVVLPALGCAPGGATPKAQLDPPIVLVAPPVEKAVQDYTDYTGRTDAVEYVNIRARVSGYLVKINFTPGKDVKKGDVLFVIDKRPYEAALEKALADIKLADAKIKQTEADVARNRPLLKSGATTQAEFDKLIADRDVATAQRDAYRAQAESSRLNVDFCNVTSPIDGRPSRNFITEGNLVTADSTLLTTIVSQDTMHVYFDVDERTMLKIQELIREGKFKSARRNNDVTCFVGLANEPGQFPHEATVDFVDNRVDPSTGTLRCRAVLKNPIIANDDRMFSAGLFVRVRVPLGPAHKAILISERAVGTDQGQKFVYVVNDKNEVMRQPVVLGQIHDGLRVVDEGLKGTESVITTGLQRVRPGMVVQPKSQADYAKEQADKAKAKAESPKSDTSPKHK